MQEFPPRGSGNPKRRAFLPGATWVTPSDLDERWTWAPGKMLLGVDGQRLIGYGDDRHVVTVAGPRAGKSKTVLEPNLLRYPGSAIVLDPKGELVKSTSQTRRKLGPVYVLDPFGELPGASDSYNPFEELAASRPEHVAPNASLLADALIIGNEKDPHWTDAAKNLIRGLVLHLLTTDGPAGGLFELRRLLNADMDTLERTLKAMAASSAFDGDIANTGTSFLGKLISSEREFQGILSTAQEQTAPLQDVLRISKSSNFMLSDLKKETVTIYLVLPGMRIGTHFRWLRLIIQQAMNAMEQTKTRPGALPVWFVLEEFSVLGYMKSIETAAGFMAGFGVKLWSVLQDLTQLKTHYPNSWETFLGNAGLIQAFGNFDLTTTKYLSDLMGQTSVMEEQNTFVTSAQRSHGDDGIRQSLRSVPLLSPPEIAFYFARETMRQLVLIPGGSPLYLSRLPFTNEAP